MNKFDFTNIERFRVRLPSPLYPYRGREFLQTSDAISTSEAPDWLRIHDLSEFFPARFHEKHPLNIPGPIYGAETDTCGTGPMEAPNNVLLDHTGREFVFKQAGDAHEFRDLLSAAICECFRGYGSDGDAHWRLSTIRDWWRNRGDMLRQEIGAQWCKPESVERWKQALRGDAEGYLRIYAFFVENGRMPVADDSLPDGG